MKKPKLPRTRYATLVFPLPEEQYEFDLVQKAGKLHIALWDIQNELRRRVKYAEEGTTDEIFKEREEIYAFVNQTIGSLLDE